MNQLCVEKKYSVQIDASEINGSGIEVLDGSPGLVVVGGDSCSEGRGFNSQHCILDGQFSHPFVVKF